MLILLSCAKTMGKTINRSIPELTTPIFEKNASELALYLSQFSVEELETSLGVNPKIALENYKRYQEFHNNESATASLLSYTGIVFKQLNPKDFSKEDFLYAQDHLLITSFCYGLLRPLDRINPYRLEGNVTIPELGEQNLYHYWRPYLTYLFIERVRQQGNILVNLASEEMKLLFDWKRVEESVQVITPEFRVWKNDKLSTIVIYTKMNRGNMTRYILKNRITDPQELLSYSWEGFEYQPALSDNKKLVFTNGF